MVPSSGDSQLDSANSIIQSVELRTVMEKTINRMHPVQLVFSCRTIFARCYECCSNEHSEEKEICYRHQYLPRGTWRAIAAECVRCCYA